MSKLKKVKVRELTPDEIRERQMAEMSATMSDSEMTFGTNTTRYLDESDTVTNEWTESEEESELLSTTFRNRSLSRMNTSGQSFRNELPSSKSMERA